MRFSRRIRLVPFAAVGIIAVVSFAPPFAAAESPAPLEATNADLADWLSFVFQGCSDLADAADDALQEYSSAQDAMEVVCDIYGLFSGECAAATVYTAVQRYQYNQAVEAFLECWSA